MVVNRAVRVYRQDRLALGSMARSRWRSRYGLLGRSDRVTRWADAHPLGFTIIQACLVTILFWIFTVPIAGLLGLPHFNGWFGVGAAMFLGLFWGVGMYGRNRNRN